MIEIIPACDINAAVKHERSVKEFRPTALVVTRLYGAYVLTTSPKQHRRGLWWPVQGGLDKDTVAVGAARELKEEINLEACPDRITVLDGMRQTNTTLRDGYTKGKLLIGCFVDCDDSNARCGVIKPNQSEIIEVEFAQEDQMREIMATNVERRPDIADKAEFVLHLLDMITA